MQKDCWGIPMPMCCFHAIMDALLGAAALGDIGKLFPDQDDAFLNISSLILLEKVRGKLEKSGYCVVNIDATVIAQQPKRAPYIQDMRQCIAEKLGIGCEQVNVKGTTEEKLGFTGDGSGLLCCVPFGKKNPVIMCSLSNFMFDKLHIFFCCSYHGAGGDFYESLSDDLPLYYLCTAGFTGTAARGHFQWNRSCPGGHGTKRLRLRS